MHFRLYFTCLRALGAIEENVECDAWSVSLARREGIKIEERKKASLGKRLESLSLQMALSTSVFYFVRLQVIKAFFPLK